MYDVVPIIVTAVKDFTGSYGRSLRKTGAAAWLLEVAMPNV
jgi:hypothetical protein